MPTKVQNSSYVERATFVAIVFMFLITVALNYSSVQVTGKTAFLVVHVTVPSEEVGSEIASVLLKERLAACINIIPGVKSVYRWKGKINKDSEFMLEIKTKSDLFDSLVTAVKATHPYEVPEVIAFPMQYVSESYSKWLAENMD